MVSRAAAAACAVTLAALVVYWLFAPQGLPLVLLASTGVVCAVHLGIVRGALEVYGGDPTHTDLLPFSEPGACRLEMLEAAPPTGR